MSTSPSSEVCDLCFGLRGHARLKQHITDAFVREYERAVKEHERLKLLYTDVCWYYFETKCRTWTHPWPQSILDSHIELSGAVYGAHGRRGGEFGIFPTYYCGPVRDAPPLPPKIIFKELQNAKEYMLECEENCKAPYQWAPGGVLYDQLRQQTLVGKTRKREREFLDEEMSNGY